MFEANNLLVPDHFDVALIADQLRCAGVIEAVRVSRLGYPQRFLHNQFIARYHMLESKRRNINLTKYASGEHSCTAFVCGIATHIHDNTPPQLKCELYFHFSSAKALVGSITQQLMGQTDLGIQVGKTKVFFRRKAFDLLEKLRRERTTSAALILQKTARKHLALKHCAKTILSAITIQSAVRKALAKKVVMGMRQQQNATIIQRSWQKYAAKKLLSLAKIVARWCQSHYRGKVGRCLYNMLNRERKAILIVSQWPRYIAMTSFKRQINAVMAIQSARRCYMAKVELKARKSEA